MDFNASSSTIRKDEPCDRDLDCKFDNRGMGKIKFNAKAEKPKAKKGKKSAPPPTRSFDQPSAAKGKGEAPFSPQIRSEEEGLENKGATCDEDRTSLVRVRAGMSVAEILFLDNEKGDVYEGPFDLKSPLQFLLDFDQLLLPRKTGIKFHFQDYFYASFLLYHPVFYPCTNICKSPDQRIENNR